MADIDMVDANPAASPATPIPAPVPAEPLATTTPKPRQPNKGKHAVKPPINLQVRLDKRVNIIKEGDTVLVKLPSETIRAVTVQKDG